MDHKTTGALQWRLIICRLSTPSEPQGMTIEDSFHRCCQPN